MFLTSANLVHYLFERGLVTPQQVVDGDYMVVEAHRRNRNFKVMRRDRSGLFLKQPPRWDAQSLATVQLEAQCYKLTAGGSELSSLRDLMPRFHLYDERRAVLVTELLANAETMAEYHVRNGAFPDEIATQLGRAFGRYHGLVRAGRADSGADTMPLFARRTPWILSFHQISPHMLVEASGGNHQLLAILRQYTQFGVILDQLAAGWRPESLIHGDIKWDNCVLVPGDDGKVEVKLVDWELADWGDPCWDVAAIFSAFIVFWIQSLPLAQGAAQAVRLTQRPIERMQPAMRKFWQAYSEQLGLGSRESRDLLRRAVLYCGARTIQTVYECVQSSPKLNDATLYMLQASLNILSQPEEATAELMGIRVQ
ncbi:MAG: phosphotransferase [Acidobacteria bacterium]|nr:phosphotransferase [Acidobacteriota bacterium]